MFGSLQGELWLVVSEAYVLVVFVVEFLIKLGAEHPFHHYFYDSWNVFDFVVLAAILLTMGMTDQVHTAVRHCSAHGRSSL